MPNPFADAVWPAADREQLIQALGGGAGFDLEPVAVRGAEVEEKLRAAGPALVPVPGGFVGVRRVRGGRVELLAPDLSTRRVRRAEIEAVLWEPHEETHRAALVELLESCGVRGAEQQRAVAAMARERIHHRKITTIWQLRMSPSNTACGWRRGWWWGRARWRAGSIPAGWRRGRCYCSPWRRSGC